MSNVVRNFQDCAKPLPKDDLSLLELATTLDLINTFHDQAGAITKFSMTYCENENEKLVVFHADNLDEVIDCGWANIHTDGTVDLVFVNHTKCDDDVLIKASWDKALGALQDRLYKTLPPADQDRISRLSINAMLGPQQE